MRRSLLGRVVPATFTLAGVAVPSVTAASILLHAMTSSTTTPAALPPSSSGKSVAAVVTPTTQSSAANPAPTMVATGTVTGPAIDDPYGQVQATITVSGSKITNVSISAPESDPRSASINQQAVP